jgi:hypothetical protein
MPFDSARTVARFHTSQHKELSMPFILLKNKVADFAQWKAVYDTHLPMRSAAGLTEKYLFRDVEDANEITLLFVAEDLDRARAFMTSPDLRERMQDAGVLDKPEISLLNREGAI